MKPICVPCQRFLKMKKAGYYFIEGMPVGRPDSIEHPRPGKVDADQWIPYKLWAGDLWECPECKAQIIHGTGKGPIAEHYQEDFKAKVGRYGAEYQVNDC